MTAGRLYGIEQYAEIITAGRQVTGYGLLNAPLAADFPAPGLGAALPPSFPPPGGPPARRTPPTGPARSVTPATALAGGVGS